jgi:hypothetical protein
MEGDKVSRWAVYKNEMYIKEARVLPSFEALVAAVAVKGDDYCGGQYALEPGGWREICFYLTDVGLVEARTPHLIKNESVAYSDLLAALDESV